MDKEAAYLDEQSQALSERGMCRDNPQVASELNRGAAALMEQVRLEGVSVCNVGITWAGREGNKPLNVICRTNIEPPLKTLPVAQRWIQPMKPLGVMNCGPSSQGGMTAD